MQTLFIIVSLVVTGLMYYYSLDDSKKLKEQSKTIDALAKHVASQRNNFRRLEMHTFMKIGKAQFEMLINHTELKTKEAEDVDELISIIGEIEQLRNRLSKIQETK